MGKDIEMCLGMAENARQIPARPNEVSFMPPRIGEVKVYFSQRGISDQEAEEFFLFYEKRQWTSCRGNLFKNWKSIAYRWIAGVWKKDPLSFDKRNK